MAGAYTHRRRIDERRAPAPVEVPPLGSVPLKRKHANTMLDVVLRSARKVRRAVTTAIVEWPNSGDELGIRALATVRPLVRDTDVIWPLEQRSLLVILIDVDGMVSDAAIGRLRRELANQRGVQAGVGAATAAPGISATELIDLAIANVSEPPISISS